MSDIKYSVHFVVGGECLPLVSPLCHRRRLPHTTHSASVSTFVPLSQRGKLFCTPACSTLVTTPCVSGHRLSGSQFLAEAAGCVTQQREKSTFFSTATNRIIDIFSKRLNRKQAERRRSSSTYRSKAILIALLTSNNSNDVARRLQEDAKQGQSGLLSRQGFCCC